MKGFLESKFRTLELVTPETMKERGRNKPKSFHAATSEEDKPEREKACAYCKGDHFIHKCKEFVKLSVAERHNAALKNKLCFNCLIPYHAVFRCKHKTSCRICKKKHHSLLHQDRSKPTEEKNTSSGTCVASQTEDATETKIAAHYSRKQHPGQQVLLATALVDVISSSGESHVCRALIDQGSEASFVTARTVELLGLKKTEVSSIVSGIGEEKQSIKHKVFFHLLSSSREPFEVKAYVMKSISSRLPSKFMKINKAELQPLTLADPKFGIPGKIVILLGADVFGRIIEGLIRLQNGLVAQQTCLGWILSGETNKSTDQEVITTLFINEEEDTLKRFWEIETDSYTKRKILTKEEEECESIYKNTTVRDKEGNYVVQLPLKQTVEKTIQKIGDTKHAAIQRFQQLERKFQRNNDFKKNTKW